MPKDNELGVVLRRLSHCPRAVPPASAPSSSSGQSALTGFFPLVGLDAADVGRLLGDENFQEAAQTVLKLSPHLWSEQLCVDVTASG